MNLPGKGDIIDIVCGRGQVGTETRGIGLGEDGEKELPRETTGIGGNVET